MTFLFICGIVAMVITAEQSVIFESQTNSCYNGFVSTNNVIIYVLLATNTLLQGNQVLSGVIFHIVVNVYAALTR